MRKLSTLLLSLSLLSGCMVSAKPYEILLNTPGYLTTKDKPTEIISNISSLTATLSMNLMDQLGKEGGNTFVSAPSLMIALAMTMNGAKDGTFDQMKAAFNLQDLDLDAINEGMRAMQLALLQSQGIDFHLTNSIWMRDTFKERVLDSFLDINRTHYAPMIASGDFNDPQMVDAINQWVSKATRKTIKTAIDEPIDPLTQMFLINTLYFKGDWQIQFEKINTMKRPFRNVDVDMMAITESFQYTENDLGQVIALPYKGSDVVMIVSLPKGEKQLSVAQMIDALDAMQLKSVDFQLPKVHTEHTYPLNPFLIDLGMVDAFNGSAANFSGIAVDARQTGLHIADVTQKTFLSIDEEGTEAAAMTKVEMRDESMILSDATMHINRPFSLIIYDPIYKIVIFSGFIQNPSGGQ